MSYLNVSIQYSVVLLISLVDTFALFEFIQILKAFWSLFYILIIKFNFPLIPVASLYAAKRFSREDTWKWQTHEKKVR